MDRCAVGEPARGTAEILNSKPRASTREDVRKTQRKPSRVTSQISISRLSTSRLAMKGQAIFQSQ